jgi:hypothetical protein
MPRFWWHGRWCAQAAPVTARCSCTHIMKKLSLFAQLSCSLLMGSDPCSEWPCVGAAEGLSQGLGHRLQPGNVVMYDGNMTQEVT